MTDARASSLGTDTWFLPPVPGTVGSSFAQEVWGQNFVAQGAVSQAALEYWYSRTLGAVVTQARADVWIEPSTPGGAFSGVALETWVAMPPGGANTFTGYAVVVG